MIKLVTVSQDSLNCTRSHDIAAVFGIDIIIVAIKTALFFRDQIVRNNFTSGNLLVAGFALHSHIFDVQKMREAAYRSLLAFSSWNHGPEKRKTKGAE